LLKKFPILCVYPETTEIHNMLTTATPLLLDSHGNCLKRVIRRDTRGLYVKHHGRVARLRKTVRRIENIIIKTRHIDWYE